MIISQRLVARLWKPYFCLFRIYTDVEMNRASRGRKRGKGKRKGKYNNKEKKNLRESRRVS